MTNKNRMSIGIALLCLIAASHSLAGLDIKNDGARLTIGRGGQEWLSYQILPMENPKGGDAFKGSTFIHPLRTPSGFAVTDCQPNDHLHHFGLWWPWKFIKVDGRKIVCWELQQNQGLIQGRSATVQENGFTAKSDYIDRIAPGGPLVVLNEETRVQVAGFTNATATGYFLDISITHQCATDTPVEIPAYRYSGFCYRGTAAWNKNNSTLLTSTGKHRPDANFTPAEWVRVQAAVPDAATAGVLLMGHPENRNHPEFLRTWNQDHNGALFINFNPVQKTPWKFEPGQKYNRRYRVFVYDGELNKEQAENLWEKYRNEK